MFYIVRDLECIFPNKINIVVSIPKFTPFALNLSCRKSFVNHQATFFIIRQIRKPIFWEARPTYGRDPSKPRPRLSSSFFIHTEPGEFFLSRNETLFPVKHCSSKFQSKHDVLKYLDVRTNALSFLKFIQNPFIVIQLADRISIVIKGILFFRGRNAKRLFWTTGLVMWTPNVGHNFRGFHV